jgi:hypothetical protein
MPDPISVSVRAPATIRFDDRRISAYLDEVSREILSGFGAYVMTVARNSILKTQGPSAPGQPPHSHKGLLKKGPYAIQFGLNPASKQVIIGAVGVGRHVVPRVLEEGGRAATKLKRRRFDCKVGGFGPIRIGGPPSKTSIPIPRAAGLRFAKDAIRLAYMTGQTVTIGKLYTARQAARAQALSDLLFGRSASGRGAPIAARPYMKPAFDKGIDKLPSIIRRAGRKAGREAASTVH